ncbi:MAG: hypothetical protein A2Y10_15900 [Planctomycetes bacterium GWF2_41_51]|nr:MAG: hypothetical protein A2Y10_15900 [Planctomycetes bacterium GWF2_41_51]HBG27584.1 hypothetical protein [Phycisphaerales bacterium]
MNQNNDNFGRILLADDEQTFLSSTAELLRNQGFYCDCAQTGEEALEKLSMTDYDLLIADIKMRGNSNLELIQNASRQHPAMSIILITGYPCQETAVEAIRLDVASYIIKPFDFDRLLENVKSAIKISLLYKAVTKTKNNLLKWVRELESIEFFVSQGKCAAFETALNNFLLINTVNVNEIFENIRFVVNLIDDIKPSTKVCTVMKCPRLSELTDGIVQAVDSIKKTKDMYKSKQLGKTREKLENLLENIRDT